MKTHSLLIAFLCAGVFASCATTAPTELVDAREAYRRASTGRAAQAAPAELHVANQALAEAEQSFRDNPDSYQTRDLAYVAQRKAQLAEATAFDLHRAEEPNPIQRGPPNSAREGCCEDKARLEQDAYSAGGLGAQRRSDGREALR